jgi:TRAP-type mannitol/chloroaromatic compound transport system substrate-binding protein
MSVERKETSREAIRDHKKVLTEILSCLSNQEASAKRLVEDQRSRRKKWNEWQANSTFTYTISTTWTSLQHTGEKH